MNPGDGFELCFYTMADSFVRVRDDGNGFEAYVRQITYRCGACGTHLTEMDLSPHFAEHRQKMKRLFRLHQKDVDTRRAEDGAAVIPYGKGVSR